MCFAGSIGTKLKDLHLRYLDVQAIVLSVPNLATRFYVLDLPCVGPGIVLLLRVSYDKRLSSATCSKVGLYNRRELHRSLLRT